MKKKYSINDLPLFSPWPARLLGLDLWELRPKNSKNIKREFKKKWDPIFERAKNAKTPIHIDQVNSWTLSTARSLVWMHTKLKLSTQRHAHDKYFKIIAKSLKNYLPANALVELGSGYGRIILSLIKQKHFQKIPAIACDYTQIGVKLLKLLAANQNSNVTSGQCDFRAPRLTSIKIPPKSLIFTSFATHYVPQLKVRFVKNLISLKPRTVVHFEPCFEHLNDRTLLGLMQKRYTQINDYNLNLVSLLKSQEKAGRIKIIKERKTVFGQNPFLPFSILAWQPR